MKEPITALDFYSLAQEDFNKEHYKQAIANFKKSIELKEEWNSYKGLGWALFRTKRYQEAIHAFRQSLTLKEDWDSYKGLGSALHNTYQFKEAINVFRKSLVMKEDWNSYKGLGSALHNINQSKEAIDPFKKSIAMRKDWDTYRGLGLALFNANQFKEAIYAFRKSFTLIDSSSSNQVVMAYRALANAYEKIGNAKASSRTWESFYKYIKPISSFDPFLGNKRIYDKISLEQLEEVKRTCKDFGFNFIPSFEQENDNLFKHWQYLMYLHIPRCGGTSFELPFHKLKNLLVELNSKSSNLNKDYKYFNAEESIMKNDQFIALINLATSNSCKNLKSIYMSTHGASWSKAYQKLCKTINKCPRIITTIREPRERLFSHIKNDSVTHTLEEINSIINSKNSRYKNAMHKFIFDYDLHGSISSSFSHQNKSKLINNIDFIDISDESTISKVKSAFLSESLLPNIIQTPIFHNSNNRQFYKLSKEEIENAFKRCIDKGFVKKDESIDYKFLKEKTLSRFSFPSFFNKSYCRIHPLTFVITNVNQNYILPTKNFLENPFHYMKI